MNDLASGDPVEGHTLRIVDHSLGELRLRTIQLGSLVIAQVSDAVHALLNSDADLARTVLEREPEVNALTAQVDKQAFECIALRQLVAGDLRMARAITRIVVDLERVGDEAKKLALISRRMRTAPQREPVVAVAKHLRHMAELADTMLRRSLRSLDEADLALAAGVARQDDELDREFAATIRLLLTRVLEGRPYLRAVIDTVFAIKGLERVGDHAKNIAEQVLFYVQGDASLAAPDSELLL